MQVCFYADLGEKVNWEPKARKKEERTVLRREHNLGGTGRTGELVSDHMLLSTYSNSNFVSHLPPLKGIGATQK